MRAIAIHRCNESCHLLRGDSWGSQESPQLESTARFPKKLSPCEFSYNVLKHVACPQSLIHGWVGLAMDPQMYALIELTVFVMPSDPGDLPNYGGVQFPSTVAMKMTDRLFDMATNYFTP